MPLVTSAAVTQAAAQASWRAQRKAWLVMVALVLIWGYAWLASKIALAYCTPFTLATMRIAVGVLAMFVVLVAARRSLRPRHLKAALVMGMIQTAAFHLLNNWALSGGSTGNISILVFTMPFWVLLLAWPALGERVSPVGWISVALAAAGLIALMDLPGTISLLPGKALAVAAGATWALGVVVAKRLQARVTLDLLNFTFWQMLLGLVPMVLLVSVSNQPPVLWTPTFVAALLFLGIPSTALGWWMWLYVLRVLPAGLTGLSSLGVPVVALLGAYVHLGERPSALEWLGTFLILAALALLSIDAWRRSARRRADTVTLSP